MTTKELFARIHSIPNEAWLLIMREAFPNSYPDLNEITEVQVLHCTDTEQSYVTVDSYHGGGLYYMEVWINGGVKASWSHDPTPINIPAMIETMTKAMEEIKP